jgi:colicin import membrane protein
LAAQVLAEQEAKQAIQQKVNRSWIRPVSVEAGLKCTIRVKLMSDGTVIDAEVISSSGDEIFDRSAENAVNKASPLPVPKDKELFAREFRTFEFLFNPK